MPEPKTYGLTHLAIAVKNVVRTMHFYKLVFDMEVMYQHEGFLQMTTPGSNDILVFEEKDSSNIGSTGGIAHFGFRLKRAGDINAIAESITKAGGTIISTGEFVPGSPYVFFKDPDNYEVEVWYELMQ